MRASRLMLPLILMIGAAEVAQASLPISLGYREGEPLEVKRAVAPGITHRLISRPEGPLAINVATIDLSRADLVMEAEKGKDDLYGQEPVPEMMVRLADPAARPIVGVNADFWGQRGIPINMFVDEGIIWRLPWRDGDKANRSVFAFNDSERVITVPEFSFVLRPYDSADDTETLAIERLNAEPGDATVTAYNLAYGASAPVLPSDLNQVVLRLYTPGLLPNQPATASVLSVDMRTGVTLDPQTMVLHIRGDLPEWLESDSDVVLDARLTGITGPVTGVVGGGPRLIADGEIIVEQAMLEESFGKSGISDRHPRTAIGLKDGGKTLVFVVVDGRQPRRSTGMTFPELADLMMELGCEHAMNVDGGGSSTLVIGSEVANFPSDAGGPRPVSNALIVRRTAPLGPLADFSVLPETRQVPVGARVPLRIAATDAAGEEMPLHGWSASQGGQESVPVESFSLLVENEGSQTIDVTLRSPAGESKVVPVTATGVPSETITASPRALLLAKGDVADFQYRFAVSPGISVAPGVIPAQIRLPDFLEWAEQGTSVRAIAEGVGAIEGTVGTRTILLPVAVDRFETVPFESMDAVPEGLVYTLLRVATPTAGPALETTDLKEGTGAWKIDYKMLPGGTAKLAVPLNATVPGEPLALGLWVRGDGSGHWLRGILSDADGDRYYLNFTSSTAGINWKDEWRFVTTSLVSPTVLSAKKPEPKPPFTVSEIYLVQPQEAAKRDGVLLLDGLSVLTLPKP